MKKLLKYLEKHIINFSTLCIFAFITILISWTINSKSTYDTLNSYIIKESNYLQNFYQVHSDWLMFWLTLIACMLAFFGILIPFLLGQSYKDKIKEMECEFEKHIKEVDKYAEIQKAQIINLKNEIKEIKKQAELSKNTIRKTLVEEVDKYRKEMQKASDDIKKDIILSEIKTLVSEAKKASDLDNIEEEHRKNQILVKLIEKNLNKFSKDNLFTTELKLYLKDAYYNLGLIEFYNFEKYSSSVKNFTMANKLHYERHNAHSKLLSRLIMCAYINTQEFAMAKEMIKHIDYLYLKDIAEYLNILSANKNKEAQELYSLINEKIIRE